MTGGLNHLYAHHQVVVKKLARIFPICTDATNLGGQMNDDMRLCVAIQLLYRFHPRQIILL